MKMVHSVALATALVATMAGAARADLNISGAVGLPLNPTAQIPGTEGARIQANYYDLGDSNSYYGLFGATRVGERLEVSAGINKLSSDFEDVDRTGFSVGAKYLITRESDPTGVRLAVGAGYDRALLKNTTAYVVGTKYLGTVDAGRTPITAHLGLRYDNFDGGFDSSDKVSVFAGVEVPVTSTGDLQVVGELGSEIADGGDTPYSLSVRYRPQGRPFGASVGFAQQGLGGGGNFFAQLGYTFNTR